MRSFIVSLKKIQKISWKVGQMKLRPITSTKVRMLMSVAPRNGWRVRPIFDKESWKQVHVLNPFKPWRFLALWVENMSPVGWETGKFLLGLVTKTRDALSLRKYYAGISYLLLCNLKSLWYLFICSVLCTLQRKNMYTIS